MTVIIIPSGDEGRYSKIVNASNIGVSTPLKAIDDICKIAGRELYIVHGKDDWDGNINELRKMAPVQEKRNKGTLINRIINYFRGR